jgi:hypothetical protein
MRFRTIPLLIAALALPASVSGQIKISGTVKCVRPDQSQRIDIGDRPNHAFAISQGKCTWIKPMTIADIQTKEDIGTNSEETSSTGARVRGYVVGTMSNGDKFTVRTFGHDVYKRGNLQSTQGTWSFTSGTGKLKGIKGGGAFTGQPDSDGTIVVDVVGQYTLTKQP